VKHDWLLGRRELWPKEQVRDLIKEAKEFQASLEDPAQATALCIFETGSQRTWLVATASRVYCILDDARKPKPEVRWSAAKKDMGGRDVKVETESDKKLPDRFGRVHIAGHKDWMYSKDLFRKTDVAEEIRTLFREPGA
jgi:hypothetical protein